MVLGLMLSDNFAADNLVGYISEQLTVIQQ